MRNAIAICSVFVLGMLGAGCAAQVGEAEEDVSTGSAAMALPTPPPPVETTNCDDEDSASDNGELNKQHRDGPQGEHGHLRVCKNDKKHD